jgi:glyoxylase-like metal-dependent hydrolase (beta-lactamase superfamily II)|tara:strand:+ start:6495 stop:7337 length:843 start_codon:yes stop_codon:yes gene_type:complete
MTSINPMKAEEVVQISPLVRRITAGNASVFTGPGTNTYLVGMDEVTVVDPGPALDSHIEAILGASGTIKQIVVTHTHPDHSPGVKLLQEAIDVPAYGLITETTKDQDKTFHPKKFLLDGDLLEEEEFTLEVIHTPGHASNHLCYLVKEEGLIITGDHIMNGSTVVISPPDGNMKHYIESLEKLKNYDLKSIAPGHGEVMKEPQLVAEWIIKHRLEREEKVADALRKAGKGSSDSLVEDVYNDVDPSLFPIAKWSLQAHLLKLADDGKAIQEGENFTWETS